jgi:hypothetical protein
MQRYTVVWHQDALDELSSIWISASDRRAITEATRQVDSELSADAGHCGEGSEERRIFVVSPLWVFLSINRRDRKAIVRRVLYRPRRES